MVIYEDYDRGFGMDFLNGIEIADRIDAQQGAVFAHAGAGSPRLNVCGIVG